jgi:hypothetical protein
VVVGAQENFDPLPQRGVAGTGFVEEGGPLRGRSLLHSGEEQRLYLLLFGWHGFSPGLTLQGANHD